jgi:NAD(P)-dependent dehydrogenase (short-subunit alcohol dehydrogenase family)
MSGRTIVITGASDGVGAAAARRLVKAGDAVVVVGRSPQKTAAVAGELGADSFVADFADLAQVRALADQLLERYPVIDILANNAGGLFAGTREVTVDGHEKTFQVNHLAPFLLTTRLLDRLIASRASVLNTSSVGNKFLGRVDIDDLDAANGFKAMRAYGTSKLENILFTRELHRRYHDQGITTAAFHPGNVASNFSSESDNPLSKLIYRTPLKRIVLISPEKGSDELVWLATGTPGRDWQSGQYYDKHKPGAVNKQADDPQLAVQLWERSEAMIAPVGPA